LSQTELDQDIRCDGDSCSARARIQVGLRAMLLGGTDQGSPTAGWLFVKQGPRWKHFCPSCASVKILALSAGHAAEGSSSATLKSADRDTIEDI
jgi:hypothetical protein